MAVSPVPRPPRTPSAARSAADVRAWQIWTLRPVARGYLLGIMVLAAGGAGYACSRTTWRGSDLLLAAALLATSFVVVEAGRSLEETYGGLFRDLASIWLLPAAVLLPAGYAFVMPFLIAAYKIVRLPRFMLYRRIFSHCTMSLAYGGASVAFHALPASVAGTGPDSGEHALPWVFCVIAVGLLAHLVNHGLLIIAIRLSDPAARIRDLVTREAAIIDLLEFSIAVIVTLVLATAGVWTLLLALPCVVYVKRSIAKSQRTLNARLDDGTGLLNERTWRSEADAAVLRALREQTPLTIIIVAIDDFADVSLYADQSVPRQLLRDFADAIQDHLPANAPIGRTGDAQFSVLLTGAGHEEARRATEGLRDGIAARTFSIGSGSDHIGWVFRLTISGGAAVLNSRIRDLADLVGAAGSALDAARRAGSNTVCVPSGDSGEAA